MVTSGSTGEPKGAVLTHDSNRRECHGHQLRSLEVDPSTDRWLACLPLAHVGGLAVVVRALLTDTPLRGARRFRRCSGRRRRPARSNADVARADGAATHRRVSLPSHLARRFGDARASDPQNTVATYGLTETFSGVVYEGWPLRGVELRTVGDEVQLRCPMLLRCYRDNTDPRTEDGWFPTGDAGARSPRRSQLSVFGRVDDMITSGAQKVWPVAVERILAQHPGVAEVAVVGRPDPEWGQAVTAVMVPADPTNPPSVDELRDAVKSQLPAYCAPRAIELVDTLPKTPLGKTQRWRI